MNTQSIKTSAYLSIAAVAIIVGFAPVNAGAAEKTSQGQNANLIYQSRAAGPSIYSYESSITGKVSVKPELIYVSQAYGPAIHSYAHAGNETVVPWNVEYVDTAYGQAIHSYDRHQVKGEVNVLPLTDK